MSSSGTRVAVIQQFATPLLAFGFLKFLNMECILKAISRLRLVDFRSTSTNLSQLKRLGRVEHDSEV